MASLVAALALAALVPNAAFAQSTPDPNFTPLASKHFEYTALPYQADTSNGDRGTQQGYNICNSTTEGPNSLCQTAIINGIDDFCLWGPPTPNSEIGVIEGEAVAWCTKSGYGTRIIPKGALTGVQFIKTPDYVQITGLINQDQIYIAANDSGGEMDPHGADQRGNPLGGLIFSKAFNSSNGNFVQAIEWHNFMGGGAFCLKACDPAGPNAARYCEHIFDRIGCNYNAPAAYQDGVFLSCLGENQDFPGVYTGSDGVVSTYTQPAESLGPISTMPFQPKIPATSQCTTFTSAQLYASAPVPTISSSSSVAKPSTTTPSTKTKTPTSSHASGSSSQTATATNAAARGVSAGAVGSLGAVLGASLFAALAL
jgi:hypothetical protein